MNLVSALKIWKNGVRLYIGIGIVLVTLETWWWAETVYAGSALFATRLEEVFAWLAVGLLTTALAIGPVYKTWPMLAGKLVMFDARRLIGIGAAWFAMLHTSIAYISLFKLANPLALPKTYQQAFALGIIAVLILLAMAFTSFDRAFKRMGKWWFRLHRLVYTVAIFSLLHAFLIGVHATSWLPLSSLTVAVASIFGLHFYLAVIRNKQTSVWQIVTISGMFLLLLAVLNFGYTQKLGYNPLEGKHSQHHL